MCKWPTFPSLVIGVFLLPMTLSAGEWRHSGMDFAQLEVSMQGADQATSADYRSPVPIERVPRNNMTKTAVRNEFGDPQQQLPAVGEPPISRWRYVDYTVYFERDRVIISVPNDVGVTR